MSRVALVTLPDEGAADLVRTTLAEAGIPVVIERARPEHPYVGSALAAPWRVLIAEEQLKEAQAALARLEIEMGEEVEAQAALAEVRRADPNVARAAGTGERSPDATDTRRLPRISLALALALLFPFPVVCFYARAWRRGAIFLGVFVAALALMLAKGIWDYQLAALGGEGLLTFGEQLFLIFLATKLADLFVGVGRVVLLRRQALRAAAVAAPA
jgi:hypothetical protein